MVLRRTFRNGFLTGLVLVVPIAVTAVVVLFLYNWLIGYLNLVLGLAVDDVGPVVHAAGVAVLVTAITLLGVVVAKGFGHTAVRLVDDLLKSVPVVSTIYASAQRASTTLVGEGDHFEAVAVVEWPHRGATTVGFLTDETPESVSSAVVDAGLSDVGPDEQLYNVYVPMSPNPTGGFLAIVPESRLVITDMSVDEGLQMIVTTGASGEGDTEAGEIPAVHSE